MYLTGEKELDQLAEAVSRYPHQVRREAEQALLKATVTGTNLENCSRMRALVELYRKDGTGRKFSDSLGDLHRRYQESLAQNRKNLTRDGSLAGLAQLRQAGISGTAVAGINLERSPCWKQATANAARHLKEELEQLKQELLSALEK